MPVALVAILVIADISIPAALDVAPSVEIRMVVVVVVVVVAHVQMHEPLLGGGKVLLLGKERRLSFVR